MKKSTLFNSFLFLPLFSLYSYENWSLKLVLGFRKPRIEISCGLASALLLFSLVNVTSPKKEKKGEIRRASTAGENLLLVL